MKRRIRGFIHKVRADIKQSDTLFALRRRFVDKDLKREKKAMQTTTEKTREQIKAEMRAYRKYWNCHPDDYIRYGLFRKDITMDEILDYIPMHYYYCDYYNSLFGKIVINDSDDSSKLRQYKIFIERRIPTPEFAGVIRLKHIYNADGTAEIQLKTLADAIEDGQRYFVKPIGGCCGKGIAVIDKRDGKLIAANHTIETMDDMPIDGATDYIIQKQLIQRSDLAAVNDSSLNTLRVIVRYDNGNPVILAMILRVGRAGAFCDNSYMGGLSVAVDIETGRFAKYAFREHGGAEFEKHPDNGYVFAEGFIKDWKNVKASIEDIIGRVKEYPLLGWDIAIGQDKVYALEYNMGFGIEHAQTVLGGFRRRLGIEP